MECQICFEHFDSNSFIPKILVKCGHSFCRVCLERLINKKASVQCPVCREVTKLNKKETLPTNYSLSEVIDKSKDCETKNILEKYKYFNDNDFKNVFPVINRVSEPRKLILKKINNNDFIYVEEFEPSQSYSLFNNLPKRNRRFNFNRNSYFSIFFNEYSYSLWVYRKASKCKHSYSCFEYILKNVIFSLGIAVLSKYPIKFILNLLFKRSSNYTPEILNKYTLFLQSAIGGFFNFSNIINCILGLYIDEILKLK